MRYGHCDPYKTLLKQFILEKVNSLIQCLFCLIVQTTHMVIMIMLHVVELIPGITFGIQL